VSHTRIYIAVILIVVIWLGCGVIETGYNRAYWNSIDPKLPMWEFWAQGLMCGPIGLFLCWISGQTNNGWTVTQ